jgi:hypothetical protein
VSIGDCAIFAVQNYIYSIKEPGYLSGIALGYGMDDRGFEYRQGLGIFLITTASKPALGPTSFPGGKAAGA